MTVQLDETGPGIEDWRSSIFAATVDSTTVYVYGYTEQSKQNNVSVWSLNDNIEQSWFTVNADESVDVVITRVDAAPITTAEVYPRDAGITTEAVAGGALTLTGVPINTRLRVEINGDRGEVLSIFIAPPLTTPTSTTDYTTLVETVSSINTTTDVLTVGSSANFSDGMAVLIATTGTMPGPAAGALAEHELVYVESVPSGTEVKVAARVGGAAIDFTTTGSGTITLAPAQWTDVTNTLLFPAGEHTIGRLFDIATNADVYLEAGAVVIGSFDIRNVELWELSGRGVMAGTYADYTTDVAPLAASVRKEYSIIFGYESPDWAAENAISGLTFVGSPFYINYYGIWSWTNCHVINCWHGEGDGLRTRAKGTATVDRVAEIVDCYVFAADDAIHVKPQFDSKTVSGCFSITTANACYHAGYFPSTDNSYTNQIRNCHAMHLGNADTGGYASYPYLGMNSIVKCWMDGWEAQTALGAFNYTISSLRVWGTMLSRFCHLGQVQYPFGTARDQKAQINTWTFSDCVTEEIPGQLSQLVAEDADHTPHDITFSGIRFGSVDIYDTNYGTYFEVDSLVYNLTWDTAPSFPTPADPATFVPEDGTGLSTANALATVTEVDDYFMARGNPATWSDATEATKQNAIREASFYILDTYGGRWRGRIYSTTQALDWPRVGVTDADTDLVYNSDTLPPRLKEAVAEVAYRVVQGTDLWPDISAGGEGIASSNISVGPISISETFRGVSSTAPTFPIVKTKLRGLLNYGFGNALRVSR